MNIGQQMQQALNPATNNPTAELRAIVARMQSDLKWYKEHHPDADTRKREDLIYQLNSVCRQLESYGALDAWSLIWKKLGEAKDQHQNADIALVYFPLKPTLPEYHESKQIVIDLCGYNLDPYAYDYCRGKFHTSWINEQEGRP